MNERTAYKMVLPYVVLIVLLVVGLLSSNIVMSFSDSKGSFTFSNYARIFGDPVFFVVLKNTSIWTIGSVAGQITLGMAIALLLKNVKRGQVFFRTVIIILPWATLDIVAGVMWRWMYNDMYGVINNVLMRMGLIKDAISWFATAKMAMTAVVITNIWKGFALSSVFFLARLQGIPTYLYEAAELDGAGFMRKYLFVTLPQLRPVLVTTLMLTIIWTINYFPLIYIMTGGGPGYGTETIVTYIYKQGFQFLDYNSSSALSNVLFVMILIITSFFLKLISKEQAE